MDQADNASIPQSAINQSASSPLPASTYQITRTYPEDISEHVEAEYWTCVPIEGIGRELRAHDLIHVQIRSEEWKRMERSIGQEAHFIGRVYKSKKKGLAVHIEYTGWRLPLTEVDVRGFVVTVGQQFRV